MIDDDGDDMRELRRRAERRALETALSMLDSPTTPPTARASVVRGVLADAAQRRGEDDAEVEPHQMTANQLNRALRQSEARLAFLTSDIVDAEVVPVPGGVFD